MIKVLIVEDSPVAQQFLAHIIGADPDLQVIGVANDGVEALEAAKAMRPDVITMDIHMPKLDGYAATQAIMETVPTPIVVVSASTSASEVASTFRALQAGALAVVLRPPGMGHPEHTAATRELVRTVKLMSEVKVVKRIPRLTGGHAPGHVSPPPDPAREIKLIAIGASTGGPPALQVILSGLPHGLTAPVLIVQHIAPGFVKGFAQWLRDASNFPLHMAEQDAAPMPGHGYLAPDGFHLGVGSSQRLVLSDNKPENGLRPSVAYLFRSVAKTFGPRALGVLLTGMGRDGAAELKAMKDMGAVTIAQDEASCVVYGMPGEAAKLGAATYILPPQGIAALITTLATRSHGGDQ